MHIMAIGASHCAFRDFMMKDFSELRSLILVAGVTYVGLGVAQQELRPFWRVRRVAIQAGDAVTEMLAAAEIETLFAAPLLALVTLQADGARLGRRQRFKITDLGSIGLLFIG